MEIIGKIIAKLPAQTGQGKNGTWTKQDFIIETEEQYPKKVSLTAWGDVVSTLDDLAFGSKIRASIRIESKEYNGKWYTNVTPWKVEILQAAAPAQQPEYRPQLPVGGGNHHYSQHQGTDLPLSDDGSDLPF